MARKKELIERSARAVVAAAALCCGSCTIISFQSGRAIFPSEAKVEATCAEYPESVEQVNDAIAKAATDGWRVVSTGSRVTTYFWIFSTQAVVVCYERKGGATPTPAPPVATQVTPPPPPAPTPTAPPTPPAQVVVPRFTSTPDTVQDSVSGLTWQRVVPDSRMKWEVADRYCRTLTLGGHSGDWRLPIKTELNSIVERSRVVPAIDGETFPNTPTRFFWSASRRAGSNASAWAVSFADGSADYFGFDNPINVRCVR